GGYIQGAGWLTTEELVWNDKGKLMTSGPASYKIPAVADMPLDLRVTLVENRKNPEDTVFHSKAVGEPPFMLGIAARWRASVAIAINRTLMPRRRRKRCYGGVSRCVRKAGRVAYRRSDPSRLFQVLCRPLREQAKRRPAR
ncbi:xanthine dehydrogenase, partial [Pseudomonas syringae pv. actinidiae ICMP 19096]